MAPTSTDDASESARESVGPLERGLAVLRALAAVPGGRLRPSVLARTTGLARSPIDRIATTLVRLGYLRADVSGDVVLAPRVAELGLAYLRAGRLAETLGPLAESLADELDESVSLAVPDADAVRFIAQTSRRRALSVTFRVGDALPAERCASGIAIAAEWDDADFERRQARVQADRADATFPALPKATSQPRLTETAFRALAAEAQKNGWATDDQLIEPGLIAVAVPVRDESGSVVCALSVVSHTSRHSPASLRERALPAMLRAAAKMNTALAEPESHAAAPEAAQRDDSLDPKRELGPEYLQSLARGLSVLAALSVPGGMTLSDVAQATALPRATARRSLLTLEGLGYVAAAGRHFVPLPQVLDLGYPTVYARSLADLARPHLADLVRQVHESASVAVLDGPDIRYVAHVAASRIMHVDIGIGSRFPAEATSMGRVLLAQSNREGFAVADDELEEGVRSIAVPLHGPDGRNVAALNIALHAGRATLEDVPALLLPALKATAERIDDDIRLVFALRARSVA